MANRFDNVPGLPQLYQQQSMVVDKPFIGTEVPNSPLNIPLDIYKDKYKDNLKISQGVNKELDVLEKGFKYEGVDKIRGIDGRDLYIDQKNQYKQAMKQYVSPFISEARTALQDNDYNKAESYLSLAQQEYNSNPLLQKIRENEEHFKKQESIFAEKGDDPNEVLKQEAANEQFYKEAKINPSVATLEAVGREKQVNVEDALIKVAKGMDKDEVLRSSFDFDESGNKFIKKVGSGGVGEERVKTQLNKLFRTDTDVTNGIKQHMYNYGTKLDFTFDNLRTNNNITSVASAKKYLSSNPEVTQSIMDKYGISSAESVANMLASGDAKQFDFLKNKEQQKYVKDLADSFVSKFGYSSSLEFSNIDWYDPGKGAGTPKNPYKDLFAFDKADMANYRKELFDGEEQFSDKAVTLIGNDGNFKTDTPEGKQIATLYKANEPVLKNTFNNILKNQYGYNPANFGGKDAFTAISEAYTNMTGKNLNMTQLSNMIVDDESNGSLNIEMFKGTKGGRLSNLFDALKLNYNPIASSAITDSGDGWFGKNSLAEGIVGVIKKDHSSLGIIDTDKQFLTGLWEFQSSDVSKNVGIGNTKVYKNGIEVTTSEKSKALSKGKNGSVTANDLNGFEVTSFGELGKNNIQLTTTNGDYSIVTTFDKDEIGKSGSPSNQLLTTYVQKMKDINQFTEIFSANNNYASVYKNFELKAKPGDVTEVPSPNHGFRNFMYKDENDEVYTVPIKTGVYELDKVEPSMSQIKQIVQNNEFLKNKSAFPPKQGISGFNYYGTADELLEVYKQVQTNLQQKK